LKIREQLLKLACEITEIRRDLHMHPEIGFEEERTSQIVAEFLASAGIEVHRGLGKTGVVGTLKCGDGDKSIALRADMDALEMQEQNSFSHCSVYDNKMHGCGHDGHTAMLLGAAKHLAESRNFNGTAYFIFQPAEEGLAGADAMIKDGLFDLFPADAVYGMHNGPGTPVGAFAILPGAMLCSFDTFDIVINGMGGHGAMPHQTIDPVLIAANVVTALQSVASRNIDPLQPIALSITQIASGKPTYNVIPEQATIKGAVRTLNADTRDLAENRIKALVQGVSASFGGSCRIDYKRGYPVLINSADETEIAANTARAIVGDTAVLTNIDPVMGSEDFAFMLQKKPGAYIVIGNGDGASSCVVHNPKYDFNDEIIPLGMEYWCRLVERELS